MYMKTDDGMYSHAPHLPWYCSSIAAIFNASGFMTPPNTSINQPLHLATQMELANSRCFQVNFLNKHCIKGVGFV